MKTLVALLLVFVLVPLHAISQTTLEEYNYVTKGYRVQIESGLDMKKGYKFEDLTEYTIHDSTEGTSWQVSFKALYREAEKIPCAIMCMYTNSSKPEENDFICIPQANSAKEIWAMTYKKMYSYGENKARILLVGFARLVSYHNMR